ncbi:MAG: sensor histidine kinase [Acidobacteria bacterium]|nr:sensor histidine kinase [Acidobacteriota bacterium]
MPDGSRDYAPLHRRLLRTMLATCLVPLLVVSGASYVQFQRYARQMVLDQQERVVLNHAHSIDAFVQRLQAELQAITDHYSLEELQSGELDRVFAVLQQGSGVYADLGIIDDRGNHLKYVGPYGLEGRNYGQTSWFELLRTRDLVISDLFLGYRGVPHFIIAVKRRIAGGYWILRASLSTDYISQLVESIRVGTTGEAFLLDRQGFYQTKTRWAGRLLDPSGFPFVGAHGGVRSAELTAGGRAYLYSDVWTAAGQWMLVVRQEKAEAFAPLQRAMWTSTIIILIGLVGVVVAALAISSWLVRHVREIDKQTDELHAQLTVSSKMAAVGEMATGVAHEINNPLANIETLRTWILDLVTDEGLAAQNVPEVIASARKIGDQVERCRLITHDLLRFSRRTDSGRVSTNLEGLVGEMIEMIEHRARSENVHFEIHPNPVPLPMLLMSSSKLQQVLLNILNNAVDAMEGKGGDVKVVIRRAGNTVRIAITDSGCGIAREHLPRIFEPFFTTKPVGKGTGLGLAVCYGLVQQMDGSLTVDSKFGVGSTFTLTLPMRPAEEGDAPGAGPSATGSPAIGGTLPAGSSS